MRLATPFALLLFAAACLAGCGDSSSDGDKPGRTPKSPAGASARVCGTPADGVLNLRATGVSCSAARQVVESWQGDRRCSQAGAASRSSCMTGSYRCLGASTDRGTAVSCSRAGESIAFVVEPE
jgi:hypothetical protein